MAEAASGFLHRWSALPAFAWQIVVPIFLIGMVGRAGIFFSQHAEGDELIYRALVQQLDRGAGYTLQGHPILAQGLVDPAQYGHALFFHPPGGIGLFWLSHRIAPTAGLAMVQLLSYAIFFASVMLAVRCLTRQPHIVVTALLAALCALNPIMCHVNHFYWLDGPLVAFATLATALMILAVKLQSTKWACLAGVVLGYASLIKLTALFIVPGLVLLAWALLERPRWRTLLRVSVCLIVVAGAIQLPWEIWQWIKVGSPFPHWAGKPSDRLVATNPYIHEVTVVRTAWFYVTALPRVCWTLAPAILLWLTCGRTVHVRRVGLSLVIWVAVIVAIHMVLGSMGYSKLIRYLILIVPAVLLLVYVVGEELVHRLMTADRGNRLTIALAVLLLAAAGAELLSGAWFTIQSGRHLMIRPTARHWTAPAVTGSLTGGAVTGTRSQ